MASTDQRRYQVFVSSTYLDLKEERQAVVSTLLESEAFPAGMELFPATDDDAWKLIKSVIDDSDYYLLVVGGKYGSIDPVEDISFTEKEYDYAVASGKPVLAFLHGEPDSLTVEKSEKVEEMQHRLEAFRTKVQLAKHVKFWTSAEDLAGKVALSFNKIQRQMPAVGWIRANRAASAETIAGLAAANARVTELERELIAVQSAPPPGTEDLSQGEDKLKLPLIARAGYRPTGSMATTSVAEWVYYELTWNELLGVLAPPMLVDADEGTLRDVLDTAADTELRSEARAALAKAAKKKNKDVSTARSFSYSLKIDDDSFGTVILQLKALGLIDRSDRKRSVNDTGTYWKLTPLGEARAVQVRAIRKSTDGTPALVV
jgi:hypothetical protein